MHFILFSNTSHRISTGKHTTVYSIEHQCAFNLQYESTQECVEIKRNNAVFDLLEFKDQINS